MKSRRGDVLTIRLRSEELHLRYTGCGYEKPKPDLLTEFLKGLFK